MFALLAAHVTALTTAVPTDPTPSDNNVIAGPWGLVLTIFLISAVVFLGWSLTRQLKKAQRAEDEGKYDPSDKKPRRTSI